MFGTHFDKQDLLVRILEKKLNARNVCNQCRFVQTLLRETSS